MPIEAYFDGRGKEVMADLVRRYGKKKGTTMFYALANRHKKKPKK